MSDSSAVWLITGSSRGLGRAIAEAALASGARVVATARRPAQLGDLVERFGDRGLALPLDVTDAEQARAVVARTVDAFGRVDVLVNNAGYAEYGAVEELTDEALRAQVDTNLWGVVHLTRAVLPTMRAQRSGHILQISSIGGRRAGPKLGAYHLTKFAIEGFSESLASEVAPLGIRVTIVEPGGFRTDWGGSSMQHAAPIADYDASTGAMRRLTADGYRPMGDPAKAAAVLVDLVGRAEVPLRLALGSDGLAVVRAADERNRAELAAWAQVSRSTDADDVTPDDRAAIDAYVAMTPAIARPA